MCNWMRVCWRGGLVVWALAFGIYVFHVLDGIDGFTDEDRYWHKQRLLKPGDEGYSEKAVKQLRIRDSWFERQYPILRDETITEDERQRQLAALEKEMRNAIAQVE